MTPFQLPFIVRNVLATTFLSLSLSLCLTPLSANAQVSAQWSDPVDVPPVLPGATLGGGVGYSLAIASTGRIYSFAMETPASGGIPASRLKYTDAPRASSPVWGNIPLPTSALGSGVSSPCIVIDADDNLHLAWYAPATRRIGHAIYLSASGTWTDEQFLYTASASQPVKYMQVEVDRSGTIHFLWHEGDPDVSAASADVRYARRPSGSATFTVRSTPLNLTAALNAAFPLAHFGGCDGSALAVAWREETTPGGWDVKMNVSNDNGVTWRTTPLVVANGPGNQWDPSIVIDRHNIVHLTYPEKTGIVSVLHYLRFDDVPALFAQTATVAQPLSDRQLTPDGESHELPYSCYDFQRDIVWLSWKQRHIIESLGLRDDVLLVHALRKGEVVSETERLSDVRTSGENIRFPDFQAAPDGHVFFTYETGLDTHMKLMERLATPDPLALAPSLTASDSSSLEWAFPTEFAVSYQVESSDDLVTWTPVGDPFTGDGEDATVVQAITGQARSFLRLRSTRP